MPRVYGDGHIAGTDTPGLLLWVVTALAFWKGLHEPKARKWRVLVGVALGLGFVEKMAAVAVLGPVLLWLVVGPAAEDVLRQGGRADWVDGVVTSAAMLLPLGLAFREVAPAGPVVPAAGPGRPVHDAPADLDPGRDPAVPLVVWVARRLAGAALPRHPVWGVERPALETWTAILAFAPVVGWLGNPGWWRETLPRLAHYYQLNADRRGALPDIRILYFGEIYTYSLPWHNAWVLIAITVPAGILLASVVGLIWSARPVVAGPRRDPLVLRPPPGDPPRPPDAADPGPRRRPPVPADLLLPGRLRRLGGGGDRGRAGRGCSSSRSPAGRLSRRWSWARRPGNWSRSTRSSCRITTS